MINTKTKKIENTKISYQNKTKVFEKTKSQEKKLKESADHDSLKNIQKSNCEDLPVVNNDEPINMEIDLSKKNVIESSVKPVNDEIKNVVDNSLKTE